MFDNFILAEELFPKALRSFETFILVNNNLRAKLFASLESPSSFEEIFKVTSVLFLKKIKIAIIYQFLVKNLK